MFSRRFRQTLILAAVAVVLPQVAFADSSNLGESLNSFSSDFFVPAWSFFKVLLVPLGLMMVASGLMKLKDAGDHRGQGSVMAGFVRLAVGGAMVALPSFTEVISTSFGIAADVGTKSSFDVGAINSAGGTGVIAVVSRFLGIVASPLSAVVLSLSFVIGVCLVLKGLYDLVALAGHEGGRRPHIGGIVATFVVGATLTNLPALMSVMSTTLGFGDFSASSFLSASNAGSLMSYTGSGSSVLNISSQAAKVLSQGLIPFGAIAFLRGMLIMRRVADGNPRNETMGAGMVHMLGGIALANAFMVTCTLTNTFMSQGLGMCG